MGFLDDQTKTFLNEKYLGELKDLENILSRRNVDDVIIALQNYESDKVESVIKACEQLFYLRKENKGYLRFVIKML